MSLFTPGNIKAVSTEFEVIKKAFCISTSNLGLIFYQIVQIVILGKNNQKNFFSSKGRFGPEPALLMNSGLYTPITIGMQSKNCIFRKKYILFFKKDV